MLNKLIIGLVFVLLASLGCAGKKVDESDPAILFSEAEKNISNDQYLLALEKLKTIRNKFPYSRYFAEAQLKIADVYFLQESFSEAAAAYEAFKELHPKHPKVAYAMYRIGESYFNDIPSNIARDLSPAQKAETAYIQFIEKFPNDPELTNAQKNLAKSRELLAEKELYIGNFYYKIDQNESAKRRYEKILKVYPDTQSVQEAQIKLNKTKSEHKK